MNSQLIKGAIVSKGFTQAEVARALGMHPSTFNQKINDQSGDRLTIKEARCLTELLGLDNPKAIFFDFAVADKQQSSISYAL